eukprot:Awhi_evm1s866
MLSSLVAFSIYFIGVALAGPVQLKSSEERLTAQFHHQVPDSVYHFRDCFTRSGEMEVLLSADRGEMSFKELGSRDW